MRRLQISIALLSLLAAPLAGCTSSSGSDGGPHGGNDSGVPIGTDAESNDGAPFADAAAMDATGPACVRDEDCPSGKVCNLAMDPVACVDGVACTGDTDCEACSALTNPADCHHGFHVQSICDPAQGNVCVRTLAPCEPCSADKECGTLTVGGNGQNKCVMYADGMKYCGRDSTFGCPQGFTADAMSGQCKRVAGCSATTDICPPKAAGQMCTGTDQVCPGQSCPNTGGGLCSTNNLPGELGICIGFCTDNTMCPADLPICNKMNGICIAGCTKDSCAGGKVCNLDGFCGDPCNDNANCEMRFGTGSYCNQQGGMAPDFYKNYHDADSCVAKGCEKALDCAQVGIVCDKSQSPPACVPGCFTRDDCSSGDICKSLSGMPRQPSYSRDQCRALAEKTSDAELGVCCNPGCTNRVLQCGLHQWCCGELHSPFENPTSCGTLSSTGTVRAQIGDCFDIKPPPFCKSCDPMMPSMGQCNSGWTFGDDVDMSINGGQPFQEQEWCTPVSMAHAFCSVTCNPKAADNGCPRGWSCRGFFPPCLQDADCGMGITCDGAMPNAMPNPIYGKCQCGDNGVATVACPTMYTNVGEAVTHPRCEPPGPGAPKLYCLASYHCEPPMETVNPTTMQSNYPAACLQ